MLDGCQKGSDLRGARPEPLVVAIDVRQLTQAARVWFATLSTHRACQCIANASVYHRGQASLLTSIIVSIIISIFLESQSPRVLV